MSGITFMRGMGGGIARVSLATLGESGGEAGAGSGGEGVVMWVCGEDLRERGGWGGLSVP